MPSSAFSPPSWICDQMIDNVKAVVYLLMVAILFLSWSNKADKCPVLWFCHRQIVYDKVGHLGLGVE